MGDGAAVGGKHLTSNKLVERIGVTAPIDVPDLLAEQVELVIAAYDDLRTAIHARQEEAIGPFGVASAWLDALALTDGALWDIATSWPRLTQFGAAILAQASFHRVGIQWPANEEARRLGDYLMERLVDRSISGDAEPRPEDTPERHRFLGEVDVPVDGPLQLAALASAVATSARGASRLARGGLGYRLRRLGNKLLADATRPVSTPMERVASFAAAIACYEAELDCYGQGLGFQATGRAALAHAHLARYQVFAEVFNAGDPEDLDAAIQNYRHAIVDLREGWPDWQQALLSCAAALFQRYKLKESMPDLDRAVEAYTVVLGALADDADGLASCWWKLAGALHERYRQRRRTDDYRRALEAYDSATSRFPKDSPNRAVCIADRDVLVALHATNENRDAGANFDSA